MNIYDALGQKNHRILKIMRQLEDTTAHEPAAREELLRLARLHLSARRQLEEIHLYPLLLASPKTFRTVARARHENREIEKLLDELAAADQRDPGCRYMIEYLSGMVRDHLQWEEHTLFRQAMQVIPLEQAELLGEAAERDREGLLHPMQG